MAWETKPKDRMYRWMFLPEIILCYVKGHRWDTGETTRLCERCNRMEYRRVKLLENEKPTRPH